MRIDRAGPRGRRALPAISRNWRVAMNRKGVTLLELIIVMVIIAIGSLAIAPNIGTWMTHFRLRGATRDVASVLRTAQMKAVSTNTRYRVNFNTGANSFTLEYQTTAGVYQPDGSSQALPRGVSFSDVNFAGVDWAVFNADSTSSAGHVRLRDTKGTERTIIVNASTGRVRVD
jgi:prepilin-type N-terminal cleavage/methylation domain-containing protein